MQIHAIVLRYNLVSLELYHSLPLRTETFNKVNWLEYQSRLINSNFVIFHPSTPDEIESTENFLENSISENILKSTKKLHRLEEKKSPFMFHN